MQNCVVLAAVAGTASCALGQSASLSIVASQTVVDSSLTTSITLAVYGDADFATHITGAWFGLSADGGAGVVEDMSLSSVASWGEVFEQDFGHAGDGNYNGVAMGQVVFLPFIAPSPESALGLGPVLLANFEVTIAAGSFGQIDWALVDVLDQSDWTIELLDVTTNPGGIPGTDYPIRNPELGSVRVQVIPAPSGLAILGFSGLFVGRRQRKGIGWSL